VKQVLHVGKFYPPVSGGMERAIEIVCRASAGLVESRVLVMDTGRQTVRETLPLSAMDGLQPASVEVTRVATVGAVGSVHVAPGLVRHLAAARPDLIVLHEPNPWALLSYAIARPRAPLAIWYHSDVVRPWLQYALFYAPLARHVYARADRIVVSSPALAAHAAALAPYRDRVTVVPFGIAPAEWQATPSDCAAIADVQADVGGPFVLFAGRHVPYKGVDVLLRALARTEARAVVAGDGPMRRAWMQLAADLGVGGRVRFAGEVSAGALRTLMQACAALVLPSVTRAEAFGYVQLEAMACGKPVISTDVESGVSWVNQDGRTGLIVRAGDADDLASAVGQLMNDTALRAQMGDAARQRVEREFTLVRLRERLSELYGEAGVLAPRRAAC